MAPIASLLFQLLPTAAIPEKRIQDSVVMSSSSPSNSLLCSQPTSLRFSQPSKHQLRRGRKQSLEARAVEISKNADFGAVCTGPIPIRNWSNLSKQQLSFARMENKNVASPSKRETECTAASATSPGLSSRVSASRGQPFASVTTNATGGGVVAESSSARRAKKNKDFVPDAELAQLRQLFEENGIDAYIVRFEDALQSECMADGYLRRAYISGLTGNAGSVLITKDTAALWTDGLHFLQAESQLGLEWTLMRAGTTGVPSMSEWIRDNMPEGSKVGSDLGHIAVDRAIFSEGTPGFVLDVLAQTPLWKIGLDYCHGTGHGVGAALNMHEGPQGISYRFGSLTSLQAGMIVSNGPGYYKDRAFGIRIEPRRRRSIGLTSHLRKSSRIYLARCGHSLCLAGGTLTGKNEEGILRQGSNLVGAGSEEEEEDEDEDYYDSDVEDDDEIRGFFDDEEIIELEGADNALGFEDERDPNDSRTTIRESTSTLVSQLCARVQAADGFTVTTGDIASLYEFPIDKFQRIAIEGFLKGSSLVVCAPTSSGKTLIAEAAAAATLARQKRLFYTTPLKALSNQKLREFRKLFGDANVGLLTGDAAVNREAPIMVMTTEILRNMLYQSPGNLREGSRLENVTTVVLDEVHYLSDISRGTVWEETVIYCPKGVQLICLSATVANPEDLAGWIAQVHGPTELVTGTRRPVPLTWHFSTRYELLPLLNEQGTEMNWKLSLVNSQRGSSNDSFGDGIEVEGRGRSRRGQFRKSINGSSNSSRSNGSRSGRWRGNSEGWGEVEEKVSEEALQFIRRRQVPQVQDTLRQLIARDMLPVIWFIFSRRGCDTAVKYVQDMELLSGEESREVKEAILKFEKEYPEAVRESAVVALGRGVAAHHAGCLPTWKAFVEELFQRGLIKVVFATETLAAGINMPARTTVLSSLSKRSDAGHALLSANAMLQMAGRAGRRGIDKQGHVVVVQTPFEGAEECCKILFAGVDPLVSQFTATYGMALNLLAGGKVPKSANSEFDDLPTVPFGRTLDEARELIEQSFGNYVGSEVIYAARKQLVKLEDEVERLVQKAQAETSSQVLETRITKAEVQEYNDLKDLVKQQKAVMQKMVSGMEVLSPSDMLTDSQVPPHVLAAEGQLAEKRKEISTLRKKLKKTQGYRENHQLVVLQKSRLEKIARLTDKASRISNRIKQMAPSGWKEFLQVVEVLNAVGAVNVETSELLPLGQTASAVRGENELWLAFVFTNESVLSLTSAQLAAVCGSLVSEGLKTRPECGTSILYEASRPVQEWVVGMETTVEWLSLLQAEHGVHIPCHLDIQFAGMVEAWAAGVTWKELMSDCGLDEGDVARLLRRTIDLLAQIPHMPHMAPEVAKLATQTTKVMDRPPISELLG